MEAHRDQLGQALHLSWAEPNGLYALPNTSMERVPQDLPMPLLVDEKQETDCPRDASWVARGLWKLAVQLRWGFAARKDDDAANSR